MTARVDLETVLTRGDLQALPDDGKRRELLGGELVESPSPNSRHQRVVAGIFVALRALAEAGAGEAFVAPLDVVLDEATVVQPDVFFVSARRRRIVREVCEGAPDLVVEVTSPSTQAVDRGAKLTAYQQAGVKHYWVADPEARTLEEYVLGRRGYALRARVEGPAALAPALFPGESIDLGAVWA